MTSVIDLPQDLSNAGSGGVSVEFRGISHVYGQGARKTEALRDINFTARPGEFVALLGPSGCGKSTLLSIVAGLQDLDEGVVRVDGAPIAGPGRDRGVVFQGDDSLYSWLNAIENVELPLTYRDGMSKAERRDRGGQVLRQFARAGRRSGRGRDLLGQTIELLGRPTELVGLLGGRVAGVTGLVRHDLSCTGRLDQPR